MTNLLVAPTGANAIAAAIERVLVKGDLSQLNEEQCIQYYDAVCKSVGLNPLTRPFDYLMFQGKKVLYANKGCAEQLRQVHKISIRITAREKIGDVYVVTAQAKGADGREDESTGAVQLGKSSDVANLFMKAETKAKRRVTLSICGLNMLDETEVDDVPGMRTEKKATPAPAAELVSAPPPPPAPEKESTIKQERWKPSEKQIGRYHAIRNKANWTPEEVRQYCELTYQKSTLTDLDWSEYEKLCKWMEKHPVDRRPEEDFAHEDEPLPFEK